MQMPGLEAHVSKCRRARTPQRPPPVPAAGSGAAVSMFSLSSRIPRFWAAEETRWGRAEVYLAVALLYQQSQEAAQIPGTHPPSAF